MVKYVWEVIRYTFTPRFLVSLFYSFAYYIHEQVVWRTNIHAEKDVRIHATASIRNAQNVYLGQNSHINHLCCIWA
ncbi:MAG: acyltransferase, partial [Anaerolineae bacterium]|nr:acyltransferase [Anaerolineae bacterium]